MIRRLIVVILASVLTALLFQPAYAWHEGVSLSVPLITKDPENLHGLNAGVWYDPDTLKWRQFTVFFDLIGAHYWITGTAPYTNTNIVAASPVLRYRFHEHYGMVPYIDLSIGFSYISNTHFANHNLGMHFNFQDRAGIGILFGGQEQFGLGIHVVHYSNAGLSSNNSGITIPLLVDLTYKIQ